MASSSNSEHHRQQRPAPLARHNSSFLGTIKNIVTAPLTWFAHQDDDASSGKRRRPVENVLTEPALEFVPNGHPTSGDDEEVDDATRRSKRMRLYSPPRTTQHYLDPPAAALQRSHPPPRRTSVVPRASSAVLPSTRGSRATPSPLRHHGVARTMSIDPPTLGLRRETSSSAFNFGPSASDMDMVVDSTKDVSMPPSPLSPRPSFRMRSSLTPQPQFAPSRHISEPPPLNALMSNPVFIHPPAPIHDPAPAPTLGSLAESQRTARSPSKQSRSSLLFTSSPNTANDENDDAPAQRALNQLDVYKTPLLPTRLRSSNLPTSSSAKSPAMFKSRRSSHLILMSDDRERLGRKGSASGKSPVVNETKPYAGEGGMKKLLARHKLEAQKEETEQRLKDAEVADETTPRPNRLPPPITEVPIPPPLPRDSDWFSTIPPPLSTSTSGSSLRVGRTKTSRNHIQRPSRARFSAVYEEEPDDIMDEEDDRRKERQILEEAAKKVPVFQIPADFSFANDMPPVKSSDLENVKEPPISFLPFSFAKAGDSATASKSSAGLAEPPKSDAASRPEATSLFGSSSAATLAPAPPPARVPTPESKPSSIFSIIPTPAPTSAALSGGAIPNFFANSQALKDVAIPVPPPVLNFGSSAPFGIPSSKPIQPTKDNENPFWDGDKSKASEEPKLIATLFGGSSSTFPPANKAPEVKPATSGFNVTATTEAPKLPFSFASATESKKPETDMVAPKPLFGGSNTAGTLFGDTSKPTSTLFGGITNPPVAPQPTPSPLSLSFQSALPDKASIVTTEPARPIRGAPSLDATNEAPKPLFGRSSGFSFGQGQTADKDKDKPAPPFSFGQPAPADESKPATPFSFGQSATANKAEEVKPASPFTFGAAPSTPPVAASPILEVKAASTPMFSFGSSTSLATNPAPIFGGFGGGGSTAADVSSKPFMFGAPGRPVTPPKNNDQEVRMEESPTREPQQPNGMNKAETGPTLSGGFSFCANTSTSNGIFGNTVPSPQSAPFTFGGAPASNPFAPKDKPKGFGGFGQPTSAPPAITTSFSFGTPKTAEEARPSSAGGFTFGTPTSTAPAAFSFGASAVPNPFAQAAGGSAPSSPSTFSQPSSFPFGASAPTNAFSFGSQPASPAAGANLTLPQPALSSGFGNAGGFAAGPSPSSPFSGPIALAPSTSGGVGGGSLFTIGAAPPPVQGASGSRAIKKLPRRGAVKR
ncbi:unnamed protein product [Cyclocybe aegerita]|uniref:Uncharacterized protein n=1 Tax=Cyclocybe aegerita TaxID=1973307 RepID=A0A8S0VT08_CYCAE|nr:unnamed protein product [Cyclocybe aegerita]